MLNNKILAFFFTKIKRKIFKNILETTINNINISHYARYTSFKDIVYFSNYLFLSFKITLTTLIHM